MKKKVVMLSEDTHIRTQLNKLLKDPCRFFKSPEDFFLHEKQFSAEDTVVILDDKYSGTLSGQICYNIQKRWPGIRLIVLVKKDDEMPDTPICMGSIVYLPKPMSEYSLKLALAGIECSDDLKDEEVREMAPSYNGSYLVGNSRTIIELNQMLVMATRSMCNMIITGETGSGKEIVINEIGRLSGLKITPANCSTLNTSLSESNLYGHMKGAFTGCISDRGGLIKEADGGILFLDEIENLTPDSQAPLLRFLDSGEYYTLGSDKPSKAKVHVIAATNEPISRLLAEGKLRRDFYMRIAVKTINVPPLREHLEDIPSLIRHKEKQMGYTRFISDFEAAYKHDWSGNVRELFNAVQRAHMLNPENPVITEEIILDL